MDINKIKQDMKSNKRITYDELLMEIERQQREPTYSSKNLILELEDKKIIDMKGKSFIKLFSSFVHGCDFANMSLSGTLDQRAIESVVFEDCSFLNCSNLGSLDSCIFINCMFNHCDFRRSTFINCVFKESSASDCDFRNANFSLAEISGLFTEGCTTENSLLSIPNDDNKNTVIIADQEVCLNILDSTKHLIYDAIHLLGTDDILLDSIAQELSSFIKENRKHLEKEGIRDVEQESVLCNLDTHEAWSNQIVRMNIDKPDIDWTHCNFNDFNFSGRNLTGIDFSGSIMKRCNFSGCNLTGVRFDDCDLSGSVLYKAIFAENFFANTKLENITIDEKNLLLFEKSGVSINTYGTGSIKPKNLFKGKNVI